MNSFYLVGIDGEIHVCFVSSIFFTGPPPGNLSLFDRVLTAFMQKERAAILELRIRQNGTTWVKWELYCLEAAGQVLKRISDKSAESHLITHELHADVKQMLDRVQRGLRNPDKDDPDLEISINRVPEIITMAFEEERRLKGHP